MQIDFKDPEEFDSIYIANMFLNNIASENDSVYYTINHEYHCIVKSEVSDYIYIQAVRSRIDMYDAIFIFYTNDEEFKMKIKEEFKDSMFFKNPFIE